MNYLQTDRHFFFLIWFIICSLFPISTGNFWSALFPAAIFLLWNSDNKSLKWDLSAGCLVWGFVTWLDEGNSLVLCFWWPQPQYKLGLSFLYSIKFAFIWDKTYHIGLIKTCAQVKKENCALLLIQIFPKLSQIAQWKITSCFLIFNGSHEQSTPFFFWRVSGLRVW